MSILEANTLVHLKHNIYTLEISQEIFDLAAKYSDSVVLNLRNGRLVLEAYNSNDGTSAFRPSGNFAIQEESDDGPIMEEERSESAASSIGSVSAVIEQVHTVDYYKSIGFPESSYTLKRTDFTRGFDFFVGCAIAVIEKITTSSLTGKIKTNRLLGTNSSYYGIEWWNAADWKKKLFLLSSPKKSDLVVAITSQHWEVSPTISNEELLHIKQYMERLFFIGQSFLDG